MRCAGARAPPTYIRSRRGIAGADTAAQKPLTEPPCAECSASAAAALVVNKPTGGVVVVKETRRFAGQDIEVEKAYVAGTQAAKDAAKRVTARARGREPAGRERAANTLACVWTRIWMARHAGASQCVGCDAAGPREEAEAVDFGQDPNGRSPACRSPLRSAGSKRTPLRVVRDRTGTA